jgi:pimeloyl-ACP methyl ester carboxylesterase
MATPPTLVLLPGLACDAELLAPQAQALAEAGHAVHTSLVHFHGLTLPAMAERLLAECPGPLVLVGASMGGMVALHAALAGSALQPPRVRGIALLGSTARADTPELIALRRQACSLFAAGRADEVLRANALLAFHPVAARDPGLVARYLAMVRRAGPEALIRQNEAVMARPDLRPRLGALAGPLLALVGEADRLTPPEHAREIAAAVPQGRLEIVPGAGHLLSWEQPSRVNALLLAWLASLGLPGPVPRA